VQREEVDPGKLPRFQGVAPAAGKSLDNDVRALMGRIGGAKRPAIVLGGGASTPRLGKGLRELLRKLDLPVVQTWAGLDVVPHDWPHRCGTFGVYGPRLGNFVVQHADLLLCLGTRLSQNLTGGLLNTFAPKARIAMVDVDQGEMDKFDGHGINVSDRICCTLEQFVEAAVEAGRDYRAPAIAPWLQSIERWRRDLPNDIPPAPADDRGHVDAHHFVRELSNHLAGNEAVFVDTGGNLTWTCNNLRVKHEQRVLSAWNFTPMGYALPAAIGGAAAATGRPISVVIGDGGLQLCLGELATVVRHNLPLKIILFNNHSHGIQKQTLETWLEGNYVGVDAGSGLGFADFPRIAKAMDLPLVNIAKSSDAAAQLRQVYATKGPVFCNVEINPDQKLYPVLKFGASLENQMPLMPAGRLQELSAL
jgi:acetolactate synthase-1/2/3 large subunit